METCMRGFSFIPNNKVEMVDLQYIEDGELAKTWRSAQRERLKQREQKIWQEFVKEKDIVGSVCDDDQYQFLEQIPESYMNEIMGTELQKIKELNASNRNKVQAQECPAAEEINCDNSSGGNDRHADVITLVEENGQDQCDMFHIFDEDKDEQFGLEDGVLNDSINSPPTVREIQPDPDADVSLKRPGSDVNTSSTGKSSENISNVIESSIYCAKVKELRNKINDTILDIICALDRRDIFNAEREDISRMIKRSVEFCSRFNRIYLYQLQRQIHDIKRNNKLALPFAKHTQFQSQMIRVVSLHQNLLQAFQVFHKAIPQTWCGRESESALQAMVGAVRTATSHCTALSHPKDLVAASQIYNDNLLSSCDKLEQFVNEYTVKCEAFLNMSINLNNKKKVLKPIQNKLKKRPIVQRNSTKPISESDGRLSMYSMDTLRLNTKTSSAKDNQSGGTSRARNSSLNINKTIAASNKTGQPPQSNRKSSRCRRPLMRDPQAGQPRPPRAPRLPRTRDYDICTMVEQIKACVSSHGSREISPCGNTRYTNTPHSNRSPSKDVHHTTRKSSSNTPRINPLQSPTFPRSPSPKIKSALNNILNNKKGIEAIKIIPTSGVQSAKKNGTKKDNRSLPGPSTDETFRVTPKSNNTGVNHQTQKNILLQSDPNPEYSETLMAVKEGRDKIVKSTEQCEVSKLIKQLCSGDASGNRTERSGNAKNAQLLYMSSSSPRPQPSTPHLLRILEKTIQKKVPKSLLPMLDKHDVEKLRLKFNIEEKVTENLFQYRTKFVQHMLASPMYANSAVGKPWEMIGSVSERIIDEVLLNCVKEMQLEDVLQKLYKRETYAH